MKPTTEVHPAGLHLAMETARCFAHPNGASFFAATRRAVVVSDDGRVLEVRPVHEKSGDPIDGVGESTYSFDRAAGALPVKGRWNASLATKRCGACNGTGRREPWTPDPLTAKQLAALSKLFDPWCPKSCNGRRAETFGRPFYGWSYTSIPYHFGNDNWERFDVIVCPACGHLRRNVGAVTLRKVYRASLAVVREDADATATSSDPPPA